MKKQKIEKKQNRFVAWFKLVPWWGYVIAIGLFVIQQLLYFLPKPIITGLSHQWRMIPKTPIDNVIPFIPYFFIEIYVWAYVFWFFALAHASRKSRQEYLNFIFTFVTSCFIGFILLAFVPTYMSRVDEGLLNPDGSFGPKVNSLFNGLSKFIYSIFLKTDGGVDNYNLCPSFHCLVSMLCFISVANDKKFHLGRRIYTFVMLIMISMSTCFVKQHYFIDILGGWILAIGVWFLFKVIKPGERLVKKYPNIFIFKKKNKKVSTADIPA